LLSLREGSIQGFQGLDHGDTFPVDRAVAGARAEDFDGLVLPGGVANPDFLRTDPEVRRFVRGFFERGTPVAAICHGPWTLIDAGVVRGRTLTSWPSLRTDLVNAGANWVDEEVHVDAGLVTSRKPADLPAFCAKLVEEMAEGRHERQAVGAAPPARRRRRPAAPREGGRAAPPQAARSRRASPSRARARRSRACFSSWRTRSRVTPMRPATSASVSGERSPRP